MLNSKLYGTVIVLGFRPINQLVFKNTELQNKFSLDQLKANSENIVIQGDP
jgi:hypothetical protein